MINYQLNNQKKTRASQAEGHEFESRLPLLHLELGSCITAAAFF